MAEGVAQGGDDRADNGHEQEPPAKLSEFLILQVRLNFGVKEPREQVGSAGWHILWYSGP